MKQVIALSLLFSGVSALGMELKKIKVEESSTTIIDNSIGDEVPTLTTLPRDMWHEIEGWVCGGSSFSESAKNRRAILLTCKLLNSRSKALLKFLRDKSLGKDEQQCMNKFNDIFSYLYNNQSKLPCLIDMVETLVDCTGLDLNKRYLVEEQTVDSINNNNASETVFKASDAGDSIIEKWVALKDEKLVKLALSRQNTFTLPKYSENNDLLRISGNNQSMQELLKSFGATDTARRVNSTKRQKKFDSTPGFGDASPLSYQSKKESKAKTRLFDSLESTKPFQPKKLFADEDETSSLPRLNCMVRTEKKMLFPLNHEQGLDPKKN